MNRYSPNMEPIFKAKSNISRWKVYNMPQSYGGEVIIDVHDLCVKAIFWGLL